MTCIVGLEHEGRVWMGGDSAGTREGDMALRILGDVKIFFVKDVLFGSSGSRRINQLLRFSLKIPHQKVKDDYRYLCTDLINAIRVCLKGGGNSGTEEHGEEEMEANVLTGYRGHLYNIETDYSVVTMANIGFDACGSGENYALGSLFSTQETKLSPEKRITLALTTASYFSAGVAPPFSIMVSKKYSR